MADNTGRSLIGRHIGAYHILSPLGAGGMGEVYRARDTKLRRDVAIKVLPDAFTSDPQRRARFEREAHVLAALNHPHIGAIYGFEEADGVRALVLELVEGQTLADRLSAGPLPVKGVIAIGRDIADALDAAHEKGIIHRDLKPANIKITPDGVVKVLDFGLAKLDAGDGPEPDLSQSPTVTVGGTREGVILGTVAYMSPEQARGKPLDKRTDIWAFGCVLYEMLTGRSAFAGETLPDTLARILEREPDWKALPESAPAGLRRLLRRCLDKDPKRRLRDMGDVLVELEDVLTSPGPGDASIAARRIPMWSAARMVLLLVAFATLLAIVLSRRPPTDADPMRFTFSAPEGETLVGDDAVPSPDGRRIAFVARNAAGEQALRIRSLDSPVPRQIAGTEGASTPFWSPDGQFVAFYVFAEGKLKKIDPSGGPAQNICTIRGNLGGATWNRDGTILLSPSNREPLHRVSAAGGTSEPVTSLNAQRKENSHRWPYFLPDGRHFLFTARSDVKDNTGIYIGSLDSLETKWLLAAQSGAVYAPQGYLLYVRDGTLMAQRFDANAMALSGEALAVAGDVQYSQPSVNGSFAVSADGTVLTYTRAGTEVSRLAWFDRSGTNLGSIGPEGTVSMLRLAPDGKRAAVVRTDEESGNRDIWLADLTGGPLTRLTSDPANDWWPVWSPDGAQMAFASDRASRQGSQGSVYWKAVDGTGTEELVLGSASPTDWSADGRFMIFETYSLKDSTNLWILPLFGDRKPLPVVQTKFDESGGRFSPDGKWIAYVSNESGADEVYVTPFGKPGKRRISLAGGTQPRWRGDGRELFFIGAGNKMMAVEVRAGDAFEIGAPAALFDPCFRGATTSYQYRYDVSADGQRSLWLCPVPQATPSSVTVAVHWAATLSDRAR